MRFNHVSRWLFLILLATSLGCSANKYDPNLMIGKWTTDSGKIMECNSDGSLISFGEKYKMLGTWKIEGDNLTIETVAFEWAGLDDPTEDQQVEMDIRNGYVADNNSEMVSKITHYSPTMIVLSEETSGETITLKR